MRSIQETFSSPDEELLGAGDLCRVYACKQRNRGTMGNRGGKLGDMGIWE